MTHSLQEYTKLIRKLETESQKQPLWYKTKLFFLSVLGIGYVLMMLVVALLLSVGLVAAAILTKNVWLVKVLLKFILVPLALSFIIFKAMWVRFSPPEGYYIKPVEAPKLFQLIEELRVKLNAKPVHAVVITSELNAAVMQVPRLGMLGWPRRYLILGLPLINMLSIQELGVVVAHEFGHLTRNHNRFGNWIYRIRQVWYVLLDKLEQENSGVSWVFTRFFNWYAPFFNAYSFVLARAGEYEADRESVAMTNPEIAGSALTKIYALAQYMDEAYWSSVYGKVKNEDSPPDQVFTHQVAATRQISGDSLQEYIENSLNQQTGIEDTHPSLKDRLEGMGAQASVVPVSSVDSAAVLLSEANEKLLQQFDQEWQSDIKEEWSARHERFESFRKIIDKFRNREPEELNEDELWDYAVALDEYEEIKIALPLYQTLLKKNHKHPRANYVVGQHLLYNEDDAGVALVEKAMQLDNELDEYGNELLYEYYYYTKNDEEKAKPYLLAFRNYEYERGKADDERSNFHRNTEFNPHRLESEELQQVVKSITQLGFVKKAWLVSRIVKHLPGTPAFFAIVRLKGITFKEDKMVQQVADALSDALPYGTIHVTTTIKNWRLSWKVKGVTTSRII